MIARELFLGTAEEMSAKRDEVVLQPYGSNSVRKLHLKQMNGQFSHYCSFDPIQKTPPKLSDALRLENDWC